MDEVSEQQEIAREMSEAISNPMGFGTLDEVTFRWAMRVVSSMVTRCFCHQIWRAFPQVSNISVHEELPVCYFCLKYIIIEVHYVVIKNGNGLFKIVFSVWRTRFWATKLQTYFSLVIDWWQSRCINVAESLHVSFFIVCKFKWAWRTIKWLIFWKIGGKITWN